MASLRIAALALLMGVTAVAQSKTVGIGRSPSAEEIRAVIEIVRRIDAEPGFKVLPRRWVVERTFGWLIRWRRLVRDFEQRLDVSEAMIHVAMGGLLLRRIAHH